MTNSRSDSYPSSSVERVRNFTRDLVDSGVEPSGLAFALSAVATEMSLELAADPVEAYAVLLSAIVQQTQHRLTIDDEDANETVYLSGVPKGAKVH